MLKKIGVMAVVGILLASCESPQYDVSQETIEAQIISVNSNIVAGEFAGNFGLFLGSMSGRITSDINKVGVRIKVGDTELLEDLELWHSELFAVQQNATIPLTAAIRTSLAPRTKGQRCVTYHYNHRQIKAMSYQTRSWPYSNSYSLNCRFV